MSPLRKLIVSQVNRDLKWGIMNRLECAGGFALRVAMLGLAVALMGLVAACDGDDFKEAASSPPTIDGIPTATATVGTLWTYSPTLGGKPQPVVSLAPGAPTWLSVSGGEVSGTPAATDVGTNTFTIIASNGLPPVASQSVTVDVLPIAGPPVLSGTPLGSVQVGTSWTYAPLVIGNPVPTLTLEGNAPGFLTVTGHVISGTPAASDLGVYNFTIRAANGTPPDATQTLSLSVVTQALVPPSIGGNPPSSGVAGTQWTFTPVLGGNPIPTLSIEPGAPAWVSLNGGTVQGTPQAANIGINTFSIRASNGVNPDAIRVINVNVTPTPVPPQFTSTPPTTAVEGFPFSYTPTMTGSPSPVLVLGPGAPSWVTIVPADGRIEGTPTLEDFGPNTFTLIADNGTAPQATQVVTLDVVGPFAPINDQGIPSDRVSPSIVWSGSEFLVWGGTSATTFGSLSSGARYNPDTQTWSGIIGNGAPSARRLHTAIWTGTRMLIWGGAGGTATPFTVNPFNDGAIYDPATNSWSPMSSTNAPSARFNQRSVWTGSQMLVWGGENATGPIRSGAAYNPQTDTWTTISTTGAPSARTNPSAVWDTVNSRMIVWGGANALLNPPEFYNDGASYDPVSNTWTPISMTGSPSPRSSHHAVWTGNRMIIWGGMTDSGLGLLAHGAVYNPVGDSWSSMNIQGAPSPTQYFGASAVWTGSRMMLWGGSIAGGGAYYSRFGNFYDPATNSWENTRGSALPTTLTCSYGWDPTNNRLMILGAETAGAIKAIFQAPTATAPQISAKVASILGTTSHGAEVGSEFVWRPVLAGRPWPTISLAPGAPAWLSVIGNVVRGTPSAGDVGEVSFTVMASNGVGSGGSFKVDLKVVNPAVGWTALATTAAPAAAVNPKAVWTGEGMLVWTGSSANSDIPRLLIPSDSFDTVSGDVTDRWQPGVPAIPRLTDSTLVWTGNRAIAWGGMRQAAPLEPSNVGGFVDPVEVVYSRISNLNAPDIRHRHSAVWSGTDMIVWGGTPDSTTGNNINTGGRYNLVNDTWFATSTAGAPIGRAGHTAVWTGSRMVVWGGHLTVGGNSPFGDGGRYDPATDTWTPVSTVNAPSARSGHTAIWTGTRMIVWGGTGTGGALNDGGIYDPATDTWTPIAAGGPTPRVGHSAVWTGSRMIIWGGWAGTGGNFNTGGVLDPTTGVWATTTVTGAPTGRRDHVAVWAENKMIVWGGTGNAGNLNTGAILRLP